MKANMWTIISVIFLIWAVGASVLAANYYQTAQSQQKTITGLQSLVDDVAMKTTIGINYGNGTTAWINNTILPYDISLFNATLRVANVSYDVYSWGIYITGINGVMMNLSTNQYWVFETYNNGTWEPIGVGATDYELHYNEIVMWSYRALTW